jgi:uncharacterized membrane protein YeaQ/YmgE (transglycosylase-associated protein family)
MSIIEFGLTAGVAVICAPIALFLTGKSHGGCPISVIAAFLGAYVGPRAAIEFGWVEPFLLSVGEVQFPVVTSAAGALILALLVNLVTLKRKF